MDTKHTPGPEIALEYDRDDEFYTDCWAIALDDFDALLKAKEGK